MRIFKLKRRAPSVIMLADRARETGQWQLASSLYRIALDRKPKNAPIWIQYGHALKEAGNRDDAQAAYRSALCYQPRNTDAYLHLGHVLKLQGKIAEAKAAYQQALMLDPSLDDASRELRQLGELGGRVAVIDAGSKRARPRKPTIITRADCARNAGQWDVAADLYRRALDRNPSRADIWVQYGHMLKESGDPTEAESAYRTAIGHAPDLADAHLHLGHVLKTQGQNKAAEAAYVRALALDPSAPLPELRELGWGEPRLTQLRKLVYAPIRSSEATSRPSCLRSVALPDASVVECLVSQGLRETERDFFLRLWHEYFDADWYQKNYPDVAEARIAPFEHFLRFGLKEGRQPCARLPILGSSKPVTEAEISCIKRLAVRDEVALVVTSSPNGRLKPHVRHYLDCLTRRNIGVVLIVNADQPFVGEAGLLEMLDGMFVRENAGYDFAAWAHMLRLYPELFSIETLYLLNDSVFGPTNEIAFTKLIQSVRNSRADFIGLTENYVWSWHYQSYFLSFKPGALSSDVFRQFIYDIVSFENKQDVINQYEFRLAWLLKNAGLKLELLFPMPRFGDPTRFDWRTLLHSGFPFLKVNTARDMSNVDTSGWRDLLAGEGYNVSIAEATLVEISATESAPSAKYVRARSAGLSSVASTSNTRSAGASRPVSGVRLTRGSSGLHVLICGHELSESGAPRAAFDVARVLRNSGHSVVFASPSDGPFRQRLCKIGVEVIINEMLLDTSCDSFPFTQGFDKLICNTINCWPVVARARDIVPVYWYVHESDLLHLAVRDAPALLPALRGNVTVLAPSPRTANALGVYGLTAHMVEYGIDGAADWQFMPKDGGGKVVIGVFGSYELRKGQDLASAGMLRVQRDLRDRAELRFFGRSLDSVFRSNLERIAGHEPSIVFFGELNHRECLNQMAACDVVLIPSRDDPLPFVSLDALSLGKTLVCSHSTGTSAYLQDGESGLILRENTPDDIAQTLARVIANPELRVKLGRGARAVCARTFSMRAFSERLYDALGVETQAQLPK